MKKIGLLILITSALNCLSQDRWSSFPSSSEAVIVASVSSKGIVHISSAETNGFTGIYIKLEQGKLTIGPDNIQFEIYKFDDSKHVMYDGGNGVYYEANDKYNIEYHIYFDLYPDGLKAQAVHIINVDGSGSRTYYVY